MNFNLNESDLGRKSATPEKYDAGLLFRIPRAENRIKYNISDSALPFSGVDVWNCYETSFLTQNGLPVSCMLKIIYSCQSTYIVESKSLKLYLNSYNMERFATDAKSALQQVIATIKKDLTTLLETEVTVVPFFDNSAEEIPFEDIKRNSLTSSIDFSVLETKVFDHFLESPELLLGNETDTLHEYHFHTDLLRSNCRVTNQPDWGDLFVRIKTKYDIELISIVAYLISFRKENHFHEEVVEMIYKRFEEHFKPEELVVAAMYTRRGGIDINPIRVSAPELVDKAFLNTQKRLAKTLRQ